MIARIKENLSILTPTLRWFMLGMVLANIAGSMLFSFLALYLSELGAKVTQIGFVFSAAAIVPMVLQVIGGWLSDAIGRLRVIAIGSSVACLGYLVMPLAPSWEWVLAGLCFEYVSGSLVAPSYMAFVADQSSEGTRGRVFGLTNGIFMIVGVIGAPLAGLLVQWRGYRTMLGIAFILYAIATALRVWMVRAVRFASSHPAALNGEQSNPATLRGFSEKFKIVAGMLVSGGLLSWIFLSDGIRDISFRLSGELEPLYTSAIGGLSVVQIGTLNALLSLAMMLSTPPAGWLSDHFGESRTIALGNLLQFAGLLGFVLAGSFPAFAFVYIILGLGFGIMNPAYDALVTKVVPEKVRGLAFGFFASSLGLISLPAPWLGGQLWDHFGPRIPFILTGLAALFSVWIAYTRFKLPESESA